MSYLKGIQLLVLEYLVTGCFANYYLFRHWPVRQHIIADYSDVNFYKSAVHTIAVMSNRSKIYYYYTEKFLFF